MRRPPDDPRRPNLATIVGSGLALVAAGSLLAFSSLAEQAGLQGLATGGLRPALPQHAGRPQAITVPAPATAPPAEPRDAVDELVRRVVQQDEATPEPVLRVAVAPSEPAERPKVRRTDSRARVTHETETYEWDGPPYGHAYGYYRNRGKHAEPAAVQARSVNGRAAKPPKPSKVEKPGKAKGHSKHSHGHGNGHGNGKGKGHSKHGH